VYKSGVFKAKYWLRLSLINVTGTSAYQTLQRQNKNEDVPKNSQQMQRNDKPNEPQGQVNPTNSQPNKSHSLMKNT